MSLLWRENNTFFWPLVHLDDKFFIEMRVDSSQTHWAVNFLGAFSELVSQVVMMIGSESIHTLDYCLFKNRHSTVNHNWNHAKVRESVAQAELSFTESG